MRKDSNKSAKQYYSTSLERGMSILRLFTQDRSTWTLTQISKNLDINKTSTFRFVNTLVQLGYLRKDPNTKLISLGAQVMTLGASFYRTDDIYEVGKPLIEEAFETYNVNTELALYNEDMIVVVYRREARESFVPRFPISRRKEQFYCSSLGKAILSALPQNEMLKIVEGLPSEKKTANTFANKADLIADLEKSRERGYALNNEEWVPGLIAIAAPLINLHTNEVKGAVCFDFSTIRHSIKKVEKQYAKVIIKLASDISQLLSTIR
jgi:DNA-binding IclR family transcriptional regulator